MVCGARSIGARVPLVPLCTLDEPNGFGLTQQPGLAAYPQQLAAFVGDGHDAVAVFGGLAKDVVDQREHLGQRMLGPVLGEQIPFERDRRPAGLGIDAGGYGSEP